MRETFAAARAVLVSATLFGKVDGAGGVFDDDGFEAEVFAVDGGVADAEVVGEAAEEEAFQVALAQITGETGGGEVVVFEEGGVAVDVAAEAFAEDEFRVGDVEGRVEGCAFGVLEDVFGPESLGAVVDLDGFEGLFAVCGGEGDVWWGCQSWVRMTWSNFWARVLMTGTTASPSATAKGPPGMKSFWTSMTRRASVGWRGED